MDGSFLDYGLADALGSVRAEIAALRAREADLRRAILASRNPENGREFDVFVRRGVSRRINKDALPPDILRTPKYWIETRTSSVVTRPRRGEAHDILPGPQANTGILLSNADDVDVIERM
ncbi:MAG TPA: hypothetical protein VJ928_07880 [Marivita sp.]|nr:hypothetical protein [Marivita sp.]